MIDTLFPIESAPAALGENSYYPTPTWLAELLIERYFPVFRQGDYALEPTCGSGNFQDVMPCRTLGIELNPNLAAVARAKGHSVVVGDIRTVPLPTDLTLAIGNPPFVGELIDDLLMRLAALPEMRRAGFVLPAYFFQTSSHVQTLRDKFSISVDLIPRNIFTGLSTPLCFACFDRNAERHLVGLALYDEVHDALQMQLRIRKALDTPTTWRTVVRQTLEDLGGRATLDQLYRAIEPARPSPNQWWKHKVRQQLRHVAVRVDRADWALTA